MPGYLSSLGGIFRKNKSPPLMPERNNTSDFHMDTTYEGQHAAMRSGATSDVTPSNESASKHGGAQYTRVSASDSNPQPQKQANWFTRLTVGWWLLEVLSIVMSFGSLAAIIAVLAKYDDQPLHEWSIGGVGLSLNTYLAIFTTLAKAGLVYPIINCIGQLKWIWFSRRDAPLADFVKFDEATRGPWGSMASCERWRYFIHSGNWHITYHATGHRIPTRLVPGKSHTAEVPTSNWWAGSSALSTRTDVSSGLVSISMQQGINAALWSTANVSILDIQPTCSTGNCTWPKYNSLAVCYDVRDVTTFLKIPEPSMGGPTIQNVTLPGGGDYLQYGLVIFNITSNGGMLTDNSTLGPIIHSYHIIYETTGTGWLMNATFGALEVVYHWCVNSYNTTVENGIADTKVVSSSTRVISPPISNSFADNYTLTADNNTYNITYSSSLPLARYMRKLFSGVYTAGAPLNPPAPSSDISYTMYPMLANQISTDAVKEGVSNYTRNMANSMTNSVRTHLGNRDILRTNSVEGTSFIVEKYVHVRWPWLSLLIGLVALAFLFLVATIIQSSNSKVEILKSDALGTLTTLGVGARGIMGPATLQDGSVERAKDLRVRLRKEEGGWSLNPLHD